MLFGAVGLSFVVLAALSMPIVFALGLSGFIGLLIGNFSLQKLPSSLVAGTQHWVLLAIPTFVFAGNLMERCGMSYALVNLARVLVGWVRGGLGMSVVLAEYFFSGISGSTIADVSAIGAMLTPPMLRAGYKPEHAVSLVASASAMGILVPPAIFMIVLGQITDTSVVGIFLGGFIPAAVSALCLMAVILLQAHRLQWPKDERAHVDALRRGGTGVARPPRRPHHHRAGVLLRRVHRHRGGRAGRRLRDGGGVLLLQERDGARDAAAHLRERAPHGGGHLPPRRRQHLPVPHGHARASRACWATCSGRSPPRRGSSCSP